jgi:hypothetical protein
MIDVSAVAQRMLTAVVAHFDANAWDLPERRYLAAGSPNILAADDEHLAVALDGIASGATGVTGNRGFGTLSRAAGTQHPPRATLAARLMRCVPTIDDSGEPPTAVELHEAGERLLLDPGRLLDALFVWRETELAPLNPNPQVDIGNVEVIGPMGGVAGYKVPITISPVQ